VENKAKHLARQIQTINGLLPELESYEGFMNFFMLGDEKFGFEFGIRYIRDGDTLDIRLGTYEEMTEHLFGMKRGLMVMLKDGITYTRPDK